MSDREIMIKKLKEIVIPYIRDVGFKGSFPHFRRLSEKQIDLITFQFDKWGGGFVIEISKCPPTGIVTYWGKVIEPNKVTAHDMHPDQRERIEPKNHKAGFGFRFDDSKSDDRFEKLAIIVLKSIKAHEKWWSMGNY